MMKHFDWGILLSLLGAGALAAGSLLEFPPSALILSAAILLVLLAVLSFSGRAKTKQLQKQYDELTERLNRELENHELAVSALRAENEEFRSAFFSEISHSLRMPISVIQGYAELMQKGAVDPVRESEYLDRIIHHTHRMIDVLSQKLDNAPDDTSTPAVQKQVDLIPMIRHQLQDLHSTAAAHGVTLQLVCSEESLPVFADKRLLQRILFNLIENSIKYMGREGIVTVLLAHDESTARITVRDDGMGLPEEEVSRIFDAHYRGSNSSPGSGSGYGLFLVKQAVEAQGGSVRASSRLGRGMSITFTLPLALSPA